MAFFISEKDADERLEGLAYTIDALILFIDCPATTEKLGAALQLVKEARAEFLLNSKGPKP